VKESFGAVGAKAFFEHKNVNTDRKRAKNRCYLTHNWLFGREMMPQDNLQNDMKDFLQNIIWYKCMPDTRDIGKKDQKMNNNTRNNNIFSCKNEQNGAIKSKFNK